jgi:hypothetical protein
MGALPDPVPAVRLRFSSGHNLKREDGSHDHAPVELTLAELAERFAQPKRGSKGSAGYYLCAEFAEGKRTAESVIGAPQFIMIDLDDGDWDAESIQLEMGNYAYFAHTTSSHLIETKTNPSAGPRWRVIVPVEGVTVAQHRLLAQALHRSLGWTESASADDWDKCGTKLAQAIFWPTVANDAERGRYECFSGQGDPISAEWVAEMVASETDLEAERDAMRKAAVITKQAPRVDGDSVIARFNEKHPLEDLLETYGYEAPQHGRTQWVSPRSKSGTPSLNVLTGADGTERVYSHRGSDTGTEWECMDSFDLFRLHTHEGDQAKAVRTAADELKVSPIKAVPDEPKQQPFRPYPMISFADIPLELVSADLIRGVIGTRTMTVVYGQSGSTKSFLATEMGLAIASGTEWRGNRTEKGRVIYIAAEGARGMRRRLRAARERYTLGPAEAVDFHLVSSTVRLTDEDPDVDRFVQTVRNAEGDGTALVIIDTLSQSMAGKNENAPADMTAAIAAAQRIMTELGCGVLIVHHSGKNEAAGARGHSSLRAATDTELEVKQTDDGFCTVRASKQKEGEGGAEWYHRLDPVELGEDQHGDPIHSAIVAPVGDAEATEARARRAAGGRVSKLTTEVVEACAALHSRGEWVTISENDQEASGYRAHLRDLGLDLSTTVKGFTRRSLMDQLMARDGHNDGDTTVDDGTDPAEKKKVYDKAHSAAKRRINTAKSDGALCCHGDYVWLREPDNDGPRR